jgi:acetyltransferase-like isoleucine patch superfamily enzyme
MAVSIQAILDGKACAIQAVLNEEKQDE